MLDLAREQHLSTMAKGKGQSGVQNRHIFERISYLYQAADYLSTASRAQQDTSTQMTQSQHASQKKATQNVSRHAVSDLRAVSLKVMIRQSPDMKRAMCKFCDTILDEGRTCQSTIENQSKGGKKPWADVLVIRCSTCGNSKRYPVNAARQKRKHLRSEKAKQSEQKPENDSTQNSGQAMDIDQPT